MKKISMLALLALGLVGCGTATPPAPSNPPAPATTDLAPATPDAAAATTPPADAAPAATPEAK